MPEANRGALAPPPARPSPVPVAGRNPHSRQPPTIRAGGASLSARSKWRAHPGLSALPARGTKLDPMGVGASLSVQHSDRKCGATSLTVAEIWVQEPRPWPPVRLCCRPRPVPRLVPCSCRLHVVRSQRLWRPRFRAAKHPPMARAVLRLPPTLPLLPICPPAPAAHLPPRGCRRRRRRSERRRGGGRVRLVPRGGVGNCSLQCIRCDRERLYAAGDRAGQ